MITVIHPPGQIEAIKGLMASRTKLVEEISSLSLSYTYYDKKLRIYREEIATIDAKVIEVMLTSRVVLDEGGV